MDTSRFIDINRFKRSSGAFNKRPTRHRASGMDEQYIMQYRLSGKNRMTASEEKIENADIAHTRKECKRYFELQRRSQMNLNRKDPLANLDPHTIPLGTTEFPKDQSYKESTDIDHIYDMPVDPTHEEVDTNIDNVTPPIIPRGRAIVGRGLSLLISSDPKEPVSPDLLERREFAPLVAGLSTSPNDPGAFERLSKRYGMRYISPEGSPILDRSTISTLGGETPHIYERIFSKSLGSPFFLNGDKGPPLPPRNPPGYRDISTNNNDDTAPPLPKRKFESSYNYKHLIQMQNVDNMPADQQDLLIRNGVIKLKIRKIMPSSYESNIEYAILMHRFKQLTEHSESLVSPKRHLSFLELNTLCESSNRPGFSKVEFIKLLMLNEYVRLLNKKEDINNIVKMLTIISKRTYGATSSDSIDE
ncbi:MAG: hypothetical protein KAH32_02370 [Chlamydiia bacterium]|nr:hypothetical protein [Chlamydiia bacterium]